VPQKAAAGANIGELLLREGLITNAQLDECHGRTAPVLWNGKIQNIYHYVANSEYPYAVGCFRGVVDPANYGATPLPLLGQKPPVPGMGHG
jgi:hypothetical protein